MDLSPAWQTTVRLWHAFVAAVPRLVLGIAIVLLAIGVGRVVQRVVRRGARRRREGGNLELALGRLAMAGAVMLGLLVGVTVVFPTFTPGDLVGALGIGTVAAGFAFKDILQNFLAGILLLFTKPFVAGDQIVFKTFEGTVEEIQTRATLIRTYDGRRVVIPNGELFVNPVVVNTAFPQRRMEYVIGIGYGDDIARAKQIILDVMREADGVAPDPQADVIVVGLNESSVGLRARWWSDSHVADVLIAQDRVLSEAKRRLQAAGIDLPYPTRQILFHDQTEESDGDRRRQREGWPAGDQSIPPALGIARVLRSDPRRDLQRGEA